MTAGCPLGILEWSSECSESKTENIHWTQSVGCTFSGARSCPGTQLCGNQGKIEFCFVPDFTESCPPFGKITPLMAMPLGVSESP